VGILKPEEIENSLEILNIKENKEAKGDDESS